MPIKVKNIAAGYYSDGVFHPIRASGDYDPSVVGEDSKYKTDKGRKGAKKKAKLARSIAEAARKAWREAQKAQKQKKESSSGSKPQKPKPRKKPATARKKAIAAARKARKKIAAKKNPLPIGRYVDAKVMRTRSGDVKVMLPLR